MLSASRKKTASALKPAALVLAALGLVVCLYLLLTFRAPAATAILGGQTISLELAVSEEARRQGLSGREQLPANHGLLLVFEHPGHHGIWMREMHFGIDILWLDEAGEVVHIEPDVPPETYPETFLPPAPAKYVLELPAGWAATHGVAVGDQAELSGVR